MALPDENGWGNPLSPDDPLHVPAPRVVTNDAHPPQPVLPSDSATTRAEKIERNGPQAELPPGKRQKLSDDNNDPPPESSRKSGVAPIKTEYLLKTDTKADGRPVEDRDKKRVKAKGGQNTSRSFGHSRDVIQLCKSRALVSEFSTQQCPRGQNCKFEHDIRKYLRDGKRADLTTFNAKCPVWLARGRCNAGWRCRFVSSHSEERQHDDGRKELILTEDVDRLQPANDGKDDDEGIGIVNVVSMDHKISLRKRTFAAPKSDSYTKWISDFTKHSERAAKSHDHDSAENTKEEPEQDRRAEYVEPPLLPSEKRRIYYGPETPILAPLTTQGNLPFRRLCVGLGAQVTWSEMAMSLPLIQGEKQEWALMRAHESELDAPRYSPDPQRLVEQYDQAKDIRFGAQISANKPWMALKATEVLTKLCPHLRAVDLNCGCPIDLVYRQGAGSALMDSPGKLEKMVRGMNAVSGDVPVQIKIRTGTKDAKPTAERLIERFAYGGDEAADYGLGPPGVAAITLHGRSRQQRYTRLANWEYISDCAAIIKTYNEDAANKTDTANEIDPREQSASKPDGRMYFIGNGDCYSHEDYNTHIREAGVDSVMVARGALIKPWIFEEIASGQYLDKSASERLRYVEQYARYGLECWGSDEQGVGTTRRFLLEWLSFACRYVPLGLLEHMPPRINDRPPAYRGRDDLETLLASDNVKDWVKISDMFLGPAHENFRFEPKHRSNSYEVEAEG